VDAQNELRVNFLRFIDAISSPFSHSSLRTLKLLLLQLLLHLFFDVLKIHFV